MTKTLSKQEAGSITRYGAGLVRLGLMTSDEFLILHTLLWTIRKPNQAELDPSYADIQRLTRKCRNTIAKAIGRFEGFGFMVRKPRWRLIEWGRKRADGRGRENLTARRTTNLYTFVARVYSHASVRPTASRVLETLVSSVEQVIISTPLEEALTRLAETANFQLSKLDSTLVLRFES